MGSPSDSLIGVLGGQLRELYQSRDDPITDDLEGREDLDLLEVLGQVARGHSLVYVLEAGQSVELVNPRLYVMAGDLLPFGDAGQVDLLDDGFVRLDHDCGILTAEVDTKIALRG